MLTGRCFDDGFDSPQELEEPFLDGLSRFFVAGKGYGERVAFLRRQVLQALGGLASHQLLMGNSESLETWDETKPNLVTEKQASLAQFYCLAIPNQPAVQFLPVQEKAARYCREVIKVDVKSLTEIPLKQSFSCFTPLHSVIWHDTADQPDPTPLMLIDDRSGEMRYARFSGTMQLLTSKEIQEEVSLGFGNRRYFAEK